jgi:hypothetical protein
MRKPAKDMHFSSGAEYFALGFPYKKSIKIQRHLKHFDLWLRDAYQSTIAEPIYPAFVYKHFFLSHIQLYKSTLTPGRLLSANLELELLGSGIPDLDERSPRQVASIVLSTLRWQQHRHKNVDTSHILQELVAFYREIRGISEHRDLTYKSESDPKKILDVFRLNTLLSPQPERDRAILFLTWSMSFTPSELAQLRSEDVEVGEPSSWVLRCSGVPIQLDHHSAVSIFTLLCENLKIADDFCWLFNRQDGSHWRALTENEIEVIIERYYRFAAALYGFNQYSPSTDLPDAEYLLEDEAVYTETLKHYTKALLAARNKANRTYENNDWDAAILKAVTEPTETNIVTIDEQVDWDDVLQNRSSLD